MGTLSFQARAILAIVAVLATLTACAGFTGLGPGTAKVEELQIPSITATHASELTPGGIASAQSITVTGSLYIPKQGTPPYPAMLVMHISGGLT
jgi:hypothetical protein